MYKWWDRIEEKKVNIKVEYEATPIRHLAVQCPDCNNWFRGSDITKERCIYASELRGAECHCPKCGSEFKTAYESNIEENSEFPEFYDKCLRKKVTWE